MFRKKPKFQPGELFVTNGVAEMIAGSNDFNHFVADSYARFLGGDWGDMCREDKKQNQWSLLHNESLHGVYNYSSPRFYFHTKIDIRRYHAVI